MFGPGIVGPDLLAGVKMGMPSLPMYAPVFAEA